MEHDITEVDETLRRLIRRRGELDDKIARLRAKRAKVDRKARALILEDYGTDRYSFRYGPSIVRIGPRPPRMTLTPDGRHTLAEMLARAPQFVEQVINLNYPRWGQLREFMDGYYDDGWPGFRSDYIETIESDEATISVMPVDRAPKFLQALPHDHGMAR